MGSNPPTPASRRPLKSRDRGWAHWLAARLTAAGIRPNTVSVFSVVFAAGAAAAYTVSGRVERPIAAAGCLVLAALLIQGRLLCNLMDGMIAIEGGFKTKSGEIYNELPDRIADLLIIGGAGYAVGATRHQAELAWIAAGLAVVVAYIRALGVAAGAAQMFHGPMAKPHRMALLTVASLAHAGVLIVSDRPVPVLFWALTLMVVGCLVTLGRRTRRVIDQLEAR